jgi:acetyl-CoA carboxylase biotin carboxyl carrier protein
MAQKGSNNMEKSVNAIMPGLTARVVVQEGDKVSKGQEVAVINCMKTEIRVLSEYDGVVKKILVKEWDELQVGTPMVILEV